jgi:hypothetical protein
VYERVFKREKNRIILRLSDVDLSFKAEWGPGEGERIRAQDLKESKEWESSMKTALFKVFNPNF